MTIDELPKIELHLHLEGAAKPKLVKDLAIKKNIDVSNIFDRNGFYNFRDFKDFLSVYEIATSVLQTPDDFYNLTTSALEECRKNNIIYVEFFLSPQFCGGNDPGAWKEYLASIREASEHCESSLGIISRGIATCIRHFGAEVAKDTVKCAVAEAGDWLVGFGMAGDEAFGSPRDFSFSFEMAKEAGLKLTSHAGEWCGAEAVAETINALEVQRIGHGVQVINDERLVQLLVEQEIVLEVCPGSNIFLGLYSDLLSHPIQNLIDKGVKVTVSTDDPPFFRTSMNEEYAALTKAFGWTKDEFMRVNRVAVEGAFCDQGTKQKLFQKLKLE